jgi:predicted nucleic acid-binding protein
MLSNVRGFSTGFHDASADVTQTDSTRTRAAAPSLKGADIGKHVRATPLLGYLDRLSPLRTVRLADVRHMIEARNLSAKGIGLTDAHLIASCLATSGTQIWTRDEKLG